MRVDFKGLEQGVGLEPIIRIELQDSEDVRDGLLKAFFEKLGGESNWLNVDFQTAGIAGEVSYITLTPVEPAELLKVGLTIRDRIKNSPRAYRFPVPDNYIPPTKLRFKGRDVTLSGEAGFAWADNNKPYHAYTQEHIDFLGLREETE